MTNLSQSLVLVSEGHVAPRSWIPPAL